MPYLLEQNNPQSTWTLYTGSQGDLGFRAAPAISQGPGYSMANVACRDNEETNVRFNEVYVNCRIEVDSTAVQNGTMKVSDFSTVYEEILSWPEIKSCRVTVNGHEDLKDLNYRKKHDV